ncbi:MAG: PAS domain-containing protein [Sphaerochaetaceae bacterium]
MKEIESCELEKLRDVFCDLPCGVAVLKIGKTLECRFFNDAFARISGRTREDIDCHDFIASVIALDDRSRFEQELQKTVDSGAKTAFKCRVQNKLGEPAWFDVNISRLKDEVCCCVFNSSPDETAMFSSIVENSTTGILVAKRDSRRILYYNDSFRELYNITQGLRLNDKNLLDLIPERTALLSNDDIKGLSFDDFSEFHRQHGDRFYGIRAKAITWNGSDCYIVYLSDETYEHEKRMKQEELLNLVPIGIGICELEENRLEQVYLNDSFYRLTGIPKHGNDAGFWDSVHPDDVSTIRAVAGRLSSGSNEDSVDFRIRCAGNEYRWFRMVMSVVHRENSKMFLYCSYVNIDDSVNSQEALKKANLELKKQYSQELSQRKMLEKDSMAAIQFNVTKDQLVSYRVNQGYLKEFGSGASGAVIRPDVAANIPTEEERRIAADFFDVNKAFSRFQQGIRQFSAEYRRRLNDGRLYWLRSICRLVQDEETGDLISYTYLQNVDTQRKKELVAQSVIDDGTDFVMLVNCVSETAILIRLRDHYQDSVWNLYSEFSFDLVRKSNQWNSVAPDDRQAVREFFNIDAIVKNLENEPLATVFYKQIYPDQTVRRKKARAYYLDSVHEDIVIARRDITDIYEQEQKQKQILETVLDEAQRASRAKSDFLSRMSHDLRTPMNVIIGLTSMALDRSDNSREMKETLSDITSSAKYLLSLINDCLDLEKITSGKMVLHPVPYPYEDFYNNVLAVIGPLCSQKNITFVLEEKTSKHPTIIADKMRMDQLIYNLLSNAVKFTPVGGKIEFLVENAHVEDGLNYFTCVVRDNGIGMSEEFQHHMYEAFSQEENQITPEYQGSGLGLAITLVFKIRVTKDINSLSTKS